MADKTEVKAEEVVTPTEEVKAEAPVDAKPKTVTLVLTTEFVTTNREKTVKHGPGRVEVPEELAEELLRRQEMVNRSEQFRLSPADYTDPTPQAKYNAGGK